MKKNNKNLSEIIEYLEDIIEKRKNSNNKTYTSNLLKKGIDRISQKIGEEAIEVVIAANKKKKKMSFMKVQICYFIYLYYGLN